MNRKAFTLIELLVVVAIVGILAGFIIVALGGSKGAANDAKRKVDVNQISKQVMIYNVNNPDNLLLITDIDGCTIGGGVDHCSSDTIFGVGSALKDPNDSYYTYKSIDGINYTITAQLSNGDSYSFGSSIGRHSIASSGCGINIEGLDCEESVTGLYTINKFTLTDNVTVSTTWPVPTGVSSVEYLIIAGGGGGGSTSGYAGGGGGAGGFLTNVGGDPLLVSGTVPLVVGAGGAGGVSNSGSNGSNSSFDSIEAIGGGGGGRSWVVLAGNGGSGGGAGGSRDPSGVTVGAGSGTAGQGYDGGTGYRDGTHYFYGGGGGGAGAAGSSASSGLGADGGIGRLSSITGSAVYYAGGGGGGSSALGSEAPGIAGVGGAGGGGNGGRGIESPNTIYNITTAGEDGKGGGGGGGGLPNAGARGGSGVVIIRYLTP